MQHMASLQHIYRCVYIYIYRVGQKNGPPKLSKLTQYEMQFF